MDRWLDQEFRDFVDDAFADLLRVLGQATGGRLIVLDALGRLIAPRTEATGRRGPRDPAEEHPEAECQVRVPIVVSTPAAPTPHVHDPSDRPDPYCLGHLATTLVGPGVEDLLVGLAAEIARQFEEERACDQEIEVIGALRHEIDLLDHVARARRSERDLTAAAQGLLTDCSDTLNGAHPVACLVVGNRTEWIGPQPNDPGQDLGPGPGARESSALARPATEGDPVARAILEDLARPTAADGDHIVLHRRITGPRGAVDGAFTSWVSGKSVIGFVGILRDEPGGALVADDFAVLRCLAGELAHVAERHRSYRELRDMLFNTIKSLVAAVDAKDEYARGHSERVHRLALRMGRQLGLAAVDRQRLSWAALLHDVGKIATPEELLSWRAGLDAEEEQQVHAHVVQGCDLLAPIPQLHSILPAIRHHHERFDGRGYPDGLSGDRIPLHARIIAVAEAFDALTYAPTPEATATETTALRAIEQEAGTRFDPSVVQALGVVLADGPAQGAGSAREGEDLMLPGLEDDSGEGCAAA
jgi:putative nucleotidyltransferase with HDIG domain